jgi:hypothetical protein
MNGFSEYEVLYDMLAENYDERLQKAERERLINRIFANRHAESKARGLGAAMEKVGWAFALFGLHIL